MKISPVVAFSDQPMRSRSACALVRAGVGVAMAAVVLVGCSDQGSGPKADSLGGAKGASSSASPSPVSTDPKEAQLQYNRCMSEHGVDVPDIPAGGDGFSATTVARAPDPKAKAAAEACQKYLPSFVSDPKQAQQQKEQMHEYAQCMRDHGIDMSDDGVSSGPPADPSKLQAAGKACALSGSVSVGGTG